MSPPEVAQAISVRRLTIPLALAITLVGAIASVVWAARGATDKVDKHERELRYIHYRLNRQDRRGDWMMRVLRVMGDRSGADLPAEPQELPEPEDKP